MIFQWNFAKIGKLLAILKGMYRSRKIKKMCILLIAVTCMVTRYLMVIRPYFMFTLFGGQLAEPDEINEIRHAQIKQIILNEKGTGCKVPPLELYSEEAMAFITDIKDTYRIVCQGNDWVDCHKSECFVKDQILQSMKDLVCTYSDIMHVDDHNYYIGEPVSVPGAGRYVLNRSDHVKISCSATDTKGLGILSTRWYGLKAGFRPVALRPRPAARRHTLNVMMLAFDSASHNGFIRHMPKSYKYLSEELGAVILNIHSVVADGTVGNLFAVFTGRTEMELPDARITVGKEPFIDQTHFIFRHLRDDGYRTAFLEDMPWIGTFQYMFKGFNQQPTDHYLRSFYMEDAKNWRKWFDSAHCMGPIPSYQYLMNLGAAFLDLDGKKFCYTGITDISHDDFNLISNADNATVKFLKNLADKKMLEDTLVVVMGDHGSRFGGIRNTYQGRLEERLPLMAIILPEQLKKRRPGALEALRHNRDVLTTHFDLYATLLDAVDLKQHINDYKEPGSDIPRAMSLLEKIPKSRTCGEAGLIPHWCVCTDWRNVSATDPKYARVAKALADFIDSISEEKRDKCASRKLISTEWVMRQAPHEYRFKYELDVRHNGHFGSLRTPRPIAPNEYYQAKIIMSPGRAVFEAAMVYNVKSDYFYVTEQDISRTSAYGHEPDCVSATHPHLNKFCFCKDKLDNQPSVQSKGRL